MERPADVHAEAKTALDSIALFISAANRDFGHLVHALVLAIVHSDGNLLDAILYRFVERGMENGLKEILVSQKTASVLDLGEGLPILFVHGFPLDRSMWCRQVEGLASRFRVIVPDLPGFGRSEAATMPSLENLNDHALTMERLAQWLSELLSVLKVSEPVVFCGLSMGGYIGWQFAKNHRSQLSKLVACNTRAASDNEVTRRGRLVAARKAIEEGPEGNQNVAQQMLPKLLGDLPKEYHDESNRELIEASIISTPPSTIAAAQVGMSMRPDMESWLGEIDFPSLFVAGAFDEITPPDEMRLNADSVKGSRYACFQNAGHLAPLQSPFEFNECLIDFLD